jgi:hypothetical protein
MQRRRPNTWRSKFVKSLLCSKPLNSLLTLVFQPVRRCELGVQDKLKVGVAVGVSSAYQNPRPFP